MSDDALIRALAEAHRARDPLADPRWDALARGALSPAEREALRASHPEAYALFAPLDEAERAGLVERILAERPPVSRGRVRPQVVGLWTRRRLTTVVAAVAVAAAAAAVVLVGPRGAPLPLYTAAVAGELDVRALPAGERAIQRLGPGSSLDLVVRPAKPVSGALVARVFLVREGRARALPLAPQISGDGAVRLHGPYEGLFAGEPPGPCEIVVAVGRRVPDDPASLQAALADGGVDPRDGRLVRVPLLLVERR